MSGSELTFENICERSSLNDCGVCEDSSVSVQLDRMDEKVVFKPEELDNNSRCDCAIFFNTSNNSSSRGISLDSNSTSNSKPDYISIVELKTNLDGIDDIKDQINGGIEFAVDLLSKFDSPPWDLEWYCLVPHDTGYRRRLQTTITKNINGDIYTFIIVPINNRESLYDIVERDTKYVDV